MFVVIGDGGDAEAKFCLDGGIDCIYSGMVNGEFAQWSGIGLVGGGEKRGRVGSVHR